jgi:hypothetical protein
MYVNLGYAVVASDYAGLGTNFRNAFLDGPSNASDVITSISAARAAVPELNSRWIVMGEAEGSLAAVAVAEKENEIRDPSYLGSIAISGVAGAEQIYEHSTQGSSSLTLTSLAYGIKTVYPQFQETDLLTENGYGQGTAGYAKRWAAKFADGRSSDFLSHAVFPSLFHQDPRYFYQGTGSKKSRLYHALSNAFVARSDSGHLMPNYSYFLGDICSGALSNAYYPATNRGASLVFTNAALGLAGRAGSTVLQEFLAKRFTKNVPGNTKPNAPPNGQP